jgi:hypothetical protein
MWLVSLPVQVTMFQEAPLGPVALTGVAVWGLGVFFETVGDWQGLPAAGDAKARCGGAGRLSLSCASFTTPSRPTT